MRQMKNSGIEWVGDIPADWNIKRIAAFYCLRNEKVSDRDYPPLSVTKKGIVPQLDTAAKSDDGDNRKLVRKGDFAINSRSDRRGSCGISDYDGSVSLINIVLKPRGEASNKYYNWLFHTEQFADEFYKWGNGIVDDLWTTKWQNMKKIIIPVPPLSEQKAIAGFLDKKCGEVDALIADIQQEIETLEQYKRSVITEAVTKGLDPSVPMKDSGIDWLGEIPMLWKTKRIAAFYQLRNEKVSDKDFPPLSVTKQGVLPQLETVAKTDDGDNRKLVRRGDFAINSRSDRRGSCGISDYDGSVSLINIVLKPRDKANNKYYNWLFHTEQFADEFYKWGNGIVDDLWTTRWQNMKKIIIPVPPIENQQKIADYLDKKCKEIEEIIADKQSQIETLESYKKSLIYEYVTGKKEIIA